MSEPGQLQHIRTLISIIILTVTERTEGLHSCSVLILVPQFSHPCDRPSKGSDFLEGLRELKELTSCLRHDASHMIKPRVPAYYYDQCHCCHLCL